MPVEGPGFWCCCGDKSGFYVPCCLYGISFSMEVQSISSAVRDSSVKLIFHPNAPDPSMESANHAGTHYYPVGDWTPIQYGSTRWYHWGFGVPDAVDIWTPKTPRFQVKIQFRSGLEISPLPQVQIRDCRLKLSFFLDSAFEQIVELNPVSIDDPQGGWFGEDQLLQPGGVALSEEIDNCSPTATLTLDFESPPLGNNPINPDNNEDYIAVDKPVEGENLCYRFYEQNPEPPDETITTAVVADCFDIACDPPCTCAHARPGREYICGCDDCVSNGPFQTGNLDFASDFPAPDFYLHPVTLAETQDWTIWFWFSPHDQIEGSLLWHGSRCLELGFDINTLTVLDLLKLGDDLVCDIYHGPVGVGGGGFVSLEIPNWDDTIDQYQFIAIRHDSEERTIVLDQNDNRADQFNGQIDNVLPNPIRMARGATMTIFGNTGQIFQYGLESLSKAGCFDAPGAMGINVINGQRLTDGEINALRLAGCSAAP